VLYQVVQQHLETYLALACEGEGDGHAVADYVERDVEDAAHWLVETGDDLRNWWRFDLELIEQRMLDAFTSVADQTSLQLSQWAERARSYLVFRMPPYHRNFGKRLVKTPKLYFLDTGLAAALLGIRDAATLNLHPLRGALFETLVVGELIKQRFNDGKPAELYFWRDNTGNEVDVVFEVGTELQAVEIKSGATLVRDWLKGIAKWQSLAGAEARSPWLIYGGADAYQRDGVQVIPWSALGG